MDGVHNMGGGSKLHGCRVVELFTLAAAVAAAAAAAAATAALLLYRRLPLYIPGLCPPFRRVIQNGQFLTNLATSSLGIHENLRLTFQIISYPC